MLLAIGFLLNNSSGIVSTNMSQITVILIQSYFSFINSTKTLIEWRKNEVCLFFLKFNKLFIHCAAITHLFLACNWFQNDTEFWKQPLLLSSQKLLIKLTGWSEWMKCGCGRKSASFLPLYKPRRERKPQIQEKLINISIPAPFPFLFIAAGFKLSVLNEWQRQFKT